MPLSDKQSIQRRILSKLGKLWRKEKELRFGQLLAYVRAKTDDICSEEFYLTDEVFEKALDKMLQE